MITVLVKYHCKAGKAMDFYKAVHDNQIDALSKAEAGNHKYEYACSLEEADTLVLTEVWEDMDAVKIHAETAHYKMLGTFKAEFVESVELERYDGAKL